jgi:hypothetical protein
VAHSGIFLLKVAHKKLTSFATLRSPQTVRTYTSWPSTGVITTPVSSSVLPLPLLLVLATTTTTTTIFHSDLQLSLQTSLGVTSGCGAGGAEQNLIILGKILAQLCIGSHGSMEYGLVAANETLPNSTRNWVSFGSLLCFHFHARIYSSMDLFCSKLGHCRCCD